MSNTNERAAFESWYAKHTTESGFTMEASEVTELREDDHYGDHRIALNAKWEGWQAKAQQVAPYGQQCREAALEEAVDAIESENASRVVYTPDCIEIIRRLK